MFCFFAYTNRTLTNVMAVPVAGGGAGIGTDFLEKVLRDV
jgi:hypothetical protein